MQTHAVALFCEPALKPEIFLRSISKDSARLGSSVEIPRYVSATFLNDDVSIDIVAEILLLRQGRTEYLSKQESHETVLRFRNQYVETQFKQIVFEDLIASVSDKMRVFWRLNCEVTLFP